MGAAVATAAVATCRYMASDGIESELVCDVGMQVESMSTAELQQQLQARDVDTQDMTKFDLQDTLWAAFQAEAGLIPADESAAAVCQHTTSWYLSAAVVQQLLLYSTVQSCSC